MAALPHLAELARVSRRRARNLHAGRRIGVCVGLVCDRHQSRRARRLRCRHARSRDRAAARGHLAAQAFGTLVGSIWREGAAYPPVRIGAPFWTLLGEAGVAEPVLFVPGTFPPEPVSEGTVVSGTPLPDWGGGWGAGYTWLASDLPSSEVGFTRYGGRVERLAFNRNVAHATLVGLRAPERVEVPVDVALEPRRAQRQHQHRRSRPSTSPKDSRADGWRSARASACVTQRAGPRARAPGQGRQRRAGLRFAHSMASGRTAIGHLVAGRRGGDTAGAPWPVPHPGVARGGLGLADGDCRRGLRGRAGETFGDRAAALLNQAESAGWHLIVVGIETIDATSPIASGGSQAIGLSGAYQRLDTLVGELRGRAAGQAPTSRWSRPMGWRQSAG